MSRLGLGLLAALVLYTGSGAWADIRHVLHTPSGFDPRQGEKVLVQFHQSLEGPTSVHFYDYRDVRVRTLRLDDETPGEKSVEWDGRDEQGDLVSADAYQYTIETQGNGGTADVWDLSDATGGRRIELRDARWDASAGAVRYTLKKPSRVRVRVGLERGGPLLRTLVHGVARDAGDRAEPWDGKDASGLLDLAHHADLAIGATAFTLPVNAVLVLPPVAKVRLSPDSGSKTRRPRSSARRRGALSLSDWVDRRRDFDATILLPDAVERNSDGVPIVGGATPVRLQLGEAERRLLLNDRFEAVFFVDGQLRFEAEVAFFPMTWTFDPAGMSAGEHYLTANLRSYEGNIGVDTVKVWIEPAAARSRGAAANEATEPPGSP